MGKSCYVFTGKTYIYLTESRISTSVWRKKKPKIDHLFESLRAKRFFSFHIKGKRMKGSFKDNQIICENCV